VTVSRLEALPFEGLFTAFLLEARNRLEREGVPSDLLSDGARHDLEHSLAARLSALASRALEAGFDAHRGGRPDPFAVRLAELRPPETARYQEFLADLLAAGETGWAGRWPVLAGLLAAVTGLWVRNCAEMIRRLREDGPAIARELFDGNAGDLGPVRRIDAALSDPHDGGRSVHVLTFAADRRVVYKPRSLGGETAFAALLGWCNERGAAPALRSARSIDRVTHGWMEHIAPAACPDETAVRRFHRRAGGLLALLHACGSRDCHCDNLVACGEHPVLIDLEAWLPVRLRKWLPGAGAGDAWYEAARRVEGSVLATGLLPRWQEGRRRGEIRNVGGLGGGRPGTRVAPVWRNLNSDAMVCVWREVETPAGPNVPFLAGLPVAPQACHEEVAAGFADLYSLLLRHRGELLGPSGILAGLAGRRTRLVFRSTAAYHRLLERSLAPECCRDRGARDRALAALDGAYLETEGRPAAGPLLAAERRALERADVPLFLVPVDGTRIETAAGERVAADALEMSSLAAVRERVEALGGEDLRRQTDFLRAALAPERTAAPAAAGAGAGDPRPGREALRAAAARIARRLRERAVEGGDGSVAWIGPRHLAANDLYELTALGPDLYGGSAGIALFLAACGSALGDGASGELALRAIAPLRGLSLERWERLRCGIGGLTGIASVLYAFLWIGTLLDEAPLIQEALRLSAFLTAERIRRDAELDLTSGAAGVILAMLALEPLAPGPNPGGRTALEIAGDCADHLLDRRALAGGPAPAGMAHGVDGIAYALLRLARRTGRGDLRGAALAGLAAEREARARRASPSQVTWCRGDPGVALARLGALDAADGPEVREEIRSALEATRAAAPGATDHLCCGNLGRAEALLEGSRVLADPRLLADALEIAAGVLGRAAPSGRFGCAPWGDSTLTAPSLFRGEAGIGLSLLRLAGARDLPCCLLLRGPSRGE
jgi:type 2 lantibiotic biosynthesis protein LanM